jgi:hypothetical protein
MKRITAVTLVVASLLAIGYLPACHSFSTIEGPIDDNRVKGLIYYLPKGRIRIAGDFKSGGGGETGQSASKSQRVSATAQSLTAAPGGPSDADSPTQKNFVVTIAADIEADPSARCYLKPVRNYFYDDDIKLGINAKHLLTTGNATAEDQTAQIISTAAEIAATIARPAPGAEVKIAGVRTAGELLYDIERAIGANTVNLDSKIEVSSEALQQFVNVGIWKNSTNPEIKGILYRLKVKNKTWFRPRDVFNLLRLLPPEKLKEQIDASTEDLSDLFEQLHKALQMRQWINPRPFSLVFDPAKAFYGDEPCKIGDAKDNSVIPRTVRLPDNIDGFEITVTEESQPDIAVLKQIWRKNVGATKNNVAYGIAFRALKPYRVRVKSVEGTYFYVNESQLVLLPDTCSEHTLVLDYSRLAFVKKTTNVVFVDGIPQSLAQTAPSSVLGFLAVPKGIIQAVVPLSPGITGPPSGVQAAGSSGTTAAPQAAPSSTPSL